MGICGFSNPAIPNVKVDRGELNPASTLVASFMARALNESAKTNLATIITRTQAVTISALMLLLMIVVLVSTVHLGFLIAHELWQPPRFLIPVQGLLEIFGYFLLVLIGVELLETLKMYLKDDVIHVRVVIEVALIAVARKVITAEPEAISSLTLLAIAALILGLGITFYFERMAHTDESARSAPGSTTDRS